MPEAEDSFCPVSVPVVSLGGGAALHGDDTCRLVLGKSLVKSQVGVLGGELATLVHCRGRDASWQRVTDFVRARQLVADVNGCLGRLQAGSPWALDEMLQVAVESGDERAVSWARGVLAEAVESELVTRRMLTASFLRMAIACEVFPPASRDESVSGELAQAGEGALRREMKAPALGPAPRSVGRAWCRGDVERVVRYGDELVQAARSLERFRGTNGLYAPLTSSPVDEVLRVLVSGYSSYLVSALTGPEVLLTFASRDCADLAGSALVASFGVVRDGRVEVGVPEGVARLVERIWVSAQEL